MTYYYLNLFQSEELGLENDMIAVGRQDPAAKNRFIYANSMMHALPNSKY